MKIPLSAEELLITTNGNTHVTSIHDTNSNLLTVTDAKSQQTVYTYSNMSRTSTRQDPLLQTETYDLNGNLATCTDASGTTTYTWNTRNQLTGISGPSLSATFTYDSFGRRTGKTINSATTNCVDDGLNPILAEKWAGFWETGQDEMRISRMPSAFYRLGCGGM